MSQLHNELRRTALNRAFKNALGATQDPGGIERYGETLTPVMDLWSQPQFAFLRLEALWAGAVQQGAVVGELGIVSIVNPVPPGKTPGQLIIVDKLSATAGGTIVIKTASALSDLTATAAIALATQARDNRWWKALEPAGAAGYQTQAQMFAGTDPGGISGVTVEQIIGSATLAIAFTSPPFILRPGTHLPVSCLSANVSLTVNASGRIYSMQSSEQGLP